MRPSVVHGFFVLVGVTLVGGAQAAPPEKSRPPKCVEVAVPATAQVYLAAQPDGVAFPPGCQTFCDRAPANSPVMITLRDLGSPPAVTLSATGVALYEGQVQFGPDGFPSSAFAVDIAFGHVAQIHTSRMAALHGVFLNTRRLEAAPDYVGFAYAGNPPSAVIEQPERLAPPEMFPFLIGDGVTSDGVVEVFGVPPYADTLYLGLLVSYASFNTGEFSVKVCAATW